MSKITNPLEVYKILPKTNCRECQLPTCLAFAAAVLKQEKELAHCPYLDPGVIARLEGRIEKPASMEEIMEETLEKLKQEIRTIDLSSRAEKLGAVMRGEKLTVKCLGRDFMIDEEGNLASECHTHPWFGIPLLNYVLYGAGKKITGDWVPFRELENGPSWEPLFRQRCEKPMKELADAHTELFDDLISLFDGMRSANHYGSDVSVVLYPFPKIPILVSYWKSEGDLASKLNIFYDETAEDNLKIESLYTLGFGLASMFEKIMVKHR
ncbi:MAG: DUF3786 domain-containing protein [bacterium]|nr:DUF3786 domain-containing protein [bacterium]